MLRQGAQICEVQFVSADPIQLPAALGDNINSDMKKLPLPDQRHLDAAEGWLGLGDYLTANEELENITQSVTAGAGGWGGTGFAKGLS